MIDSLLITWMRNLIVQLLWLVFAIILNLYEFKWVFIELCSLSRWTFIIGLLFTDCICLLHIYLHPVGLVWIASVIVGSPMLFVQQLEVSGAL